VERPGFSRRFVNYRLKKFLKIGPRMTPSQPPSFRTARRQCYKTFFLNDGRAKIS
jgi:hypothetical protein